MNLTLLTTLLKYDSSTGDFTTLVKRRDVDIGGTVGKKNDRGWVVVSAAGRGYRAHRLAWIFYYGADPGDMQIDHIDGDRSNNRISNLRLATNKQNMQNIHRPYKKNKSGFLGVYFCAKKNKYRATIKVDGIVKRLGWFGTPEVAHEKYIAAKKVLHPFWKEQY